MGLSKAQRRKTSLYYDMRDREREEGYTPDLLRNPLVVPVGHYVTRHCIWIVMSDGLCRTGTDAEEHAWADGTLGLPVVQKPRRRYAIRNN